MTNETPMPGAPHIVIQGVTDSALTLNVNGEAQEIRNELAALRALLESHQAKTVQYADKIYNIAHIDEANYRTSLLLRSGYDAHPIQLANTTAEQALLALRADDSLIVPLLLAFFHP